MSQNNNYAVIQERKKNPPFLSHVSSLHQPWPPADTCLGSVQVPAADSISLAPRAGRCVESHQPLSSRSHLGLWSTHKATACVLVISALPLS